MVVLSHQTLSSREKKLREIYTRIVTGPWHNRAGQQSAQMWKSWKSSLKLEQKSVAINSISILPAGSELELPIDLETAKESSRAALPWTLTQAPAAVEDLEAALHAGCQEHEITRGVPLQPPNPTFHVGVSQRLLHVPGVPQQHVLVVAGDTPQTGRKAAQLNQGAEER